MEQQKIDEQRDLNVEDKRPWVQPTLQVWGVCEDTEHRTQMGTDAGGFGTSAS